MEEMVSFYDPHPGFGGPITPLPKSMLSVVRELDGKTMSISDAVEAMKKVSNVGVEVKNDYITLTLIDKQGRTHHWRLISFMKAVDL